jgi:hypothetical protein
MQVLRRANTDNPAGSPKMRNVAPESENTGEEVWREREKRLEKLLEKDRGPRKKERDSPQSC